MASKTKKNDVLPMRFQSSLPESLVAGKHFDWQQDSETKSTGRPSEKDNITNNNNNNNTDHSHGEVSVTSLTATKHIVEYKSKKKIISNNESTPVEQTKKFNHDPIQILEKYMKSRESVLTQDQLNWLTSKKENRKIQNINYVNNLLLGTNKIPGSSSKKNNSSNSKASMDEKQVNLTSKLKSKSNNNSINPPPPVSSKFDANQFIKAHFPHSFLDDVTTTTLKNSDNHCSETVLEQINECKLILKKLEEKEIHLKESVLLRGLVSPVDPHQDISFDMISDSENGDKLMINPLPVKFWRTSKITNLNKKKKIKSHS